MLYQPGMLLAPEELNAEQQYFLQRQRRHNRFLHGWGVVSGLSVSVVEGVILIKPGIAIDCAGNEICLDERLSCDLPKDGAEAYVVAEYVESEVDPIPLMYGDGENQDTQSFSRILEGAHCFLLEHNPIADHTGMGPGSPGCNRVHPVPLARIRFESGEPAVTACGYR